MQDIPYRKSVVADYHRGRSGNSIGAHPLVEFLAEIYGHIYCLVGRKGKDQVISTGQNYLHRKIFLLETFLLEVVCYGGNGSIKSCLFHILTEFFKFVKCDDFG